MNSFIKAQILNITTMAQHFKQSCELAAMQDDGKISKSEEKTLKKINQATDRFIRELNSIK